MCKKFVVFEKELQHLPLQPVHKPVQDVYNLGQLTHAIIITVNLPLFYVTKVSLQSAHFPAAAHIL